MARQSHSSLTLLRRKQVEAESGYSRSTIYLRIAQRLWPRPVRLGPRAVGWPAGEVAALNAARIAGRSDDELRALVDSLHTKRSTADLTVQSLFNDGHGAVTAPQRCRLGR